MAHSKGNHCSEHRVVAAVFIPGRTTNLGRVGHVWPPRIPTGSELVSDHLSFQKTEEKKVQSIRELWFNLGSKLPQTPPISMFFAGSNLQLSIGKSHQDPSQRPVSQGQGSRGSMLGSWHPESNRCSKWSQRYSNRLGCSTFATPVPKKRPGPKKCWENIMWGFLQMWDPLVTMAFNTKVMVWLDDSWGYHHEIGNLHMESYG